MPLGSGRGRRTNHHQSTKIQKLEEEGIGHPRGPGGPDIPCMCLHSRVGPGPRLEAWMAAANPSAVVLSRGGGDIAREGMWGIWRAKGDMGRVVHIWGKRVSVKHMGRMKEHRLFDHQ